MSLRGFTLTSFLFLAAFAVSAVGCSRQTEGERCSLLNGDSDCDDDLFCTDAAVLRSNDGVDRCCPDPETTPSDSRCELKTTAAISGDGDGDTSGEGGAGGESTVDNDPKGLDSACQYRSDCTAPLICGPGGTCQHECNKTIDCDEGEVCSDERTCVAE